MALSLRALATGVVCAGLLLLVMTSTEDHAPVRTRQLRAVVETPSLTAASAGSSGNTAQTSLQRAVEEQEQFCRSLPAGDPPGLLDVDATSSGGVGASLAPGGARSLLVDWALAAERVALGEGGRAKEQLASTAAAARAGEAPPQRQPAGSPPKAAAPTVQAADSQPDPAAGGGSTRAKLLRGLQSRLWHFGADGKLAIDKSEPYSMYVYESGDIVSGSIQSTGGWERDVVLQMVSRLGMFAQARGLPAAEAIMVDIGANVGGHTLAMAAHGFSVLAFEPMHSNLACLRRSLCANPHLRQRVTLVPQGLGNTTQQCNIYSLPSNVGDGTVLCSRAGSPLDVPAEMVPRGQPLQIARLDDVLDGAALQSLAGRVGVVKIDVEGNELLVLEGGLQFFKTVRPAYVIAEASDAMMRQATGRPAAAFLTKMSRLGYEVRLDSFDGPLLPPEVLSTLEEPSIRNYYFTLG